LQPHSDDSQQDGATAGAAVAAVGLGSGPQNAKISELVEKWQKKAAGAKASASNPPKEAKAKAKANTTANKSKAKAKTNKSKAKAKTTAVKKRKTTNAKTKPKIVAMAVPGKKLILGCAKCRGNSGECSQCRNPKFSGGRGPR
jgi:membrane protein involved in colicin uptake